MRTILAMAMIIGSGTFFHAEAAHHRVVLPPHANRFVGSTVDPRLTAPLDRDLGMCNGGRCTLTGGPSGGPDQS